MTIRPHGDGWAVEDAQGRTVATGMDAETAEILEDYFAGRLVPVEEMEEDRKLTARDAEADMLGDLALELDLQTPRGFYNFERADQLATIAELIRKGGYK